MKLFSKAPLFLFLLFLAFPVKSGAFESCDIVSPRQGSWSNRQPLVLSGTEGCDVYFSLSGSDPALEGFAYDGPVLIDMAGSVNLKIAVFDSEGNRKDFSVRYSVFENYSSLEKDDLVFIKKVASRPLFPVSAEKPLELPSGWAVYINDSEIPYTEKKISVCAQNILESYASVILSKNTEKYRFVIKSTPASGKTLSLRNVPFQINDWENVIYTGHEQIFQLDSSLWSSDRKPVTIDRSRGHTIRWQSYSFNEGNPVSSVYLPPKPQISSLKNKDGSFSFSITSPYQVCLEGKNSLFSSWNMDVFPESHKKGTMTFDVYKDGVFQGKLQESYDIDRKAPSAPEIKSSSSESYERKEVKVSIQGEKDSKIYYSLISSPLEGEDDFSASEKLISSDFVFYDGKEILLKSSASSAVFYRILAYAEDESKNRSLLSDYSVIIDEYNYYLEGSEKKSVQEELLNSSSKKNTSVSDSMKGSFSNPWTNLEEALPFIESSNMDSITLHIKGTFYLDSPLVFTKNIRLVGKDARFIFSEKGTISVKNASFRAENIIFEKKSESSLSENNEKLMFIFENSDLAFISCEAAGRFKNEGILFDLNSSTCLFENSGFTVFSSSYSSCLSAENSSVESRDSRWTCISPSCVIFSVLKTSLNLTENSCTLNGRYGRVAELLDSNAVIKNNVFNGKFNLDSSGGRSKIEKAIWTDFNSFILEDEDNIENGW